MAGHGWDKARESVEQQKKAGGKFIKLENNDDKVVGAFVGAPYCNDVYYNDKTEKTEVYTAEHKAKGYKLSVKYMMNFFVISQGNGDKLEKLETPEFKILTVSLKTMGVVFKIQEKYGMGSKYFEICRSGKKGDNKTTYSVLPDVDIPAALAAKLAAAGKAYDEHVEKGTKIPEGVMECIHLEKAATGAEDETDDTKSDSTKKKNGESKGDLISVDTKNEIAARLKSLTPVRENADKFLARFGIGAIKDLKTVDVEAAKAFLSELEGKSKANSAAAAPAPAADPFAD